MTLDIRHPEMAIVGCWYEPAGQRLVRKEGRGRLGQFLQSKFPRRIDLAGEYQSLEFGEMPAKTVGVGVARLARPEALFDVWAPDSHTDSANRNE